MQASIDKLKLTLGLELIKNEEEIKKYETDYDVSQITLNELNEKVNDSKTLLSRLEARNKKVKDRLINDEEKYNMYNAHYASMETEYYKYENDIIDLENKIITIMTKNEEYKKHVQMKVNELKNLEVNFNKLEEESAIYEKTCKDELKSINNNIIKMESKIKKILDNQFINYNQMSKNINQINYKNTKSQCIDIFENNKYDYLNILVSNLINFHDFQKFDYNNIKCIERDGKRYINSKSNWKIYKNEDTTNSIKSYGNPFSSFSLIHCRVINKKKDCTSNNKNKYSRCYNCGYDEGVYEKFDKLSKIKRGSYEITDEEINKIFLENILPWVKTHYNIIINNYIENETLKFIANTLIYEEFYDLFKNSNIFGIIENNFNDIDFLNLIIFIGSNGTHINIF